MIVIIVVLFMYLMGLINISEEVNFGFTLGALILSISMAVDTFADENIIVETITMIMETCSLLVVILIPNLKNIEVIKNIMSILDVNVLLLFSLFFTFAGQWAAEMKIKDIRRKKEK